MKRLNLENKNTAEEYDRIFEERQKLGINWFDVKRWNMLLKYFKKGTQILDIGCLDSRIPEMIKGQYWGLDFAGEALNEMAKRYPNASYIKADLYKIPLGDNSKDYVVLGEIIEHLEKPKEAIEEAFRVLKPNGILALSTPLEEEKEIGAVDKEHHLWSYYEQDIYKLLTPYCSKIKIKIIGSEWFPYHYAFKTIIAWGWKK